jgi:hypothetical protein
MSELDTNFLVLRVSKFNDFFEGFHLRVKPETRVFGCDTAFGYNGRSFDDGKSRPASEDSTHL